MKRQILLSMMVIGVTSILMGTGTYACFYGTIHLQPNPSNCSDLIDIRDQNEWWGHGVTATWTADDMKPGDKFPFHCRFVGLKKHRGSSLADHIEITCDYNVIEENPQTESDTDPYTNLNPDSMAKQMIITRCKYLGWGSRNYINCLTNSNSDWRIEDKDDDGKITFYDFKFDPLKNLPAPKKWWSRDWFILSIKFDENAGNDFQGDTFDLTVSFTAIKNR